MAPIVLRINIACPPDEVFSYATDPARFASWQHDVASARAATSGPLGVGSRFTTTRRIGRAERTMTQEVTQAQPPRTWAVRGVDGPIRSIVEVTVEPAAGGARSRVTIELGFTGHGIGKLLVPLIVRPQSRKEMQRNIQRLKARNQNDAQGPTR